MRYFLIFSLLCCSLFGQEPTVMTDSRITNEIEYCCNWFTRLKEEDFYKGWKNCDLSQMSQKEKQLFLLYQGGRLESRLKKVQTYVAITMRGTLEGSEIVRSIHNMRVLLASDRETFILDLILEYPNLQTDLQFYAQQVTHYNEANHLNEMPLFRPTLP